jgi:hypothetical protein
MASLMRQRVNAFQQSALSIQPDQNPKVRKDRSLFADGMPCLSCVLGGLEFANVSEWRNINRLWAVFPS